MADGSREGLEGADPFREVRDVVAPSGDLDLAEVADRAGLPTRILRELFEAMQWDDRDSYGERDVAYAEDLGRLLDYFPLDTVARTLRTRHRTLAGLVVSDLVTIRQEVVRPALAEGADPDELAGQLGWAAEHLLPLITDSLADDYRHILARLLDSDALTRGVHGGGLDRIELAVGFVDVAGYTALSDRVDPAGLDRVLAGFEDLATAAATAAEDVLLAKFVGDAAMFVSPHVEGLAEVLLGLVEDSERLAEAPRRAGLAAGAVLVRRGDYYGTPPNLASRLTDQARPWSLLAAADLRDALEQRYAVSAIPEVTLPGLGERRPLVVRRPRDEEG